MSDQEPWALRWARELLVYHRDADTTQPLQDAETEARARLIHAAPDLLTSATACLDFLEMLAREGSFQMYEIERLQEQARAALKKATP